MKRHERVRFPEPAASEAEAKQRHEARVAELRERRYVLGVDADHMTMHWFEGRKLEMSPVRSVQDYVDFVKSRAAEAEIDPIDVCVLCSSSCDFPEEATSDPDVLKLVKELVG